jgi:hypothetical protein
MASSLPLMAYHRRMALTFNVILDDMDVPPSKVRLLRHTPNRFFGRTLYALWRDGHPDFLIYQSTQEKKIRARLNSPYWASFVVTPAKSVVFVGLFAVTRSGSCPAGTIDPLTRRDITGEDFYTQTLVEASKQYIGRVFVDWGSGALSWAQKADNNKPKTILEITRVFQEDAFPGYSRFLANLSAIETLPEGWRIALQAARGIYLLTCPQTQEQYVGSATGADGFLGRWMGYVRDGHGGNIALKSRDPSDYQVSILEVSGSVATVEEILAAEGLWKAKLQSREMGLNLN